MVRRGKGEDIEGERELEDGKGRVVDTYRVIGLRRRKGESLVREAIKP